MGEGGSYAVVMLIEGCNMASPSLGSVSSCGNDPATNLNPCRNSVIGARGDA